MTVAIVPGISALAKDYDGFILDLWGVVHDGRDPYPGAIECLGKLRQMRRRVVLLSNVPRRAATVAEAMVGMGIARSLYGHVLSSGELAYRALKFRDDPWYAALGRKCLHMGPERDKGIFEGLGLEVVQTPQEAGFVLNTGPWRDVDSLEDFEPALRACAKRGLAMVCANPDLEVIRAGKRIICAGTLAARYETLGGEVRYHGKPHGPAYEACLELMGISDRRRIVAIGDSLATDVKGAREAGLDAVLVTSGIHAEELGLEYAERPDPARLRQACVRAGHVPIAAVPAFVW